MCRRRKGWRTRWSSAAGSAGCTPHAVARGPCGSRWSTGATTTCSSRCSTRWRRPRSRPATSPRRSVRCCASRRTCEVLLAEVRRRRPRAAHGCCSTTACASRYDYLIVATGRHALVLRPRRVGAVAPGLKTIEDALEIRRRVLLAFEAAEREPDAERGARWLTFVIVGGGPTGVELAGALAEIARSTLAQRLPPHRSAAGAGDPARGRRRACCRPTSRALAGRRERAARAPRRRGAHRRVVTRDRRATASASATERIDARTVLWAAGVRASPLGAPLGAPLDRAGRVQVEPDLTVPGHPEVFVIGDLAGLTQRRQARARRGPRGDAGGRHAARNIRARLARRAAPSRSATATRARWRRSAAPRRWPRSARLRAHRLPRLVRLAVHPHLLPDRLPQPRAGDVLSGPGRTSPAARRAADHRRGGPGARPGGRAARRDGQAYAGRAGSCERIARLRARVSRLGSGRMGVCSADQRHPSRVLRRVARRWRIASALPARAVHR